MVIGHQLTTLRASVDDADPSGSVGHMMSCSWFGEFLLNFPQPRSIRVPLAGAEEKASLTGSERSTLSQRDRATSYVPVEFLSAIE